MIRKTLRRRGAQEEGVVMVEQDRTARRRAKTIFRRGHPGEEIGLTDE
jgi:hypothetical protein